MLVLVFTIILFFSDVLAYLLCERGNVCTEQNGNPEWKTDISEGRLPMDLMPLHYNLELQPNIYTGEPPFYFNGTVEIHIEVETATDIIYLNQADLTVQESSVEIFISDDSPIQPDDPEWISFDQDNNLQLFALYLSQPLTVGAIYVLRMAYDSYLGNPGSVGLFWDSYVTKEDETRYLVASTFVARRVMPCFDEPIFKATYNVTMLRQPEMISLSNMPVSYEEEREYGWVADIFGQTVKMSPYLLCVTVNDFNYVETITSKGVPVRIWSRPDALYSTAFADSIAAPILEWYEQYTGIDYVLPKLDHIALPTHPGAMEHWGLITYGEEYLLFDPDISTSLSRETVSTILAHETAHMWFGNLVTCVYWNNTWLNEGFATYFHFQPLFDVLGWNEDIIETKSKIAVMNYDSINTSYPVRYNAGNLQEAAASFNIFTYDKGSSIINMIEQIMGNNSLQRGLQRHLNKFAFSNADTNDLWESLNEQIAEDGVTDPDGNLIDIKEKMDPWIEQRGHPLIRVDRNNPDVLTLSQEIFFNPDGQEANVPSPWDYLWNIPITWTSQSNPAVNTTTRVWNDGSESIVITEDIPNNDEWILLNPAVTGFYRVLYSADDQAKITEQLLNDYTALSVHNRAQLINDAFEIARGNLQTEAKAMEFTRYLGQDISYIPWLALASNLDYQILMLSKFNDTRGSQQNYLLSIVDPAYSELGWESDGNHYIDNLRQIIISLACSFKHEDCVQQSEDLYGQYQSDAVNNPIEPNQRSTVYCTAITAGSQSDWDFAYNLYQIIADEPKTRTNATYERNLLIPSMACTSDTEQMESYLNAVYDPSLIRTRDAQSAVLSISRSSIGKPLVWSILSSNWRDNPLPEGVNKNTVFREISNSFNTEEELMELNNFIETYPPIDNTETQLYDDAVDTVERNIEWALTNKDELHAWFQEFTPQELQIQTTDQDVYISMFKPYSAALFNENEKVF